MAALHRLHGRDDAAVEAATEALELYRAGGFRRFRNRVDPTADLPAAAAACCEVLAVDRRRTGRAGTGRDPARPGGPPARRRRRRASRRSSTTTSTGAPGDRASLALGRRRASAAAFERGQLGRRRSLTAVLSRRFSAERGARSARSRMLQPSRTPRAPPRRIP